MINCYQSNKGDGDRKNDRTLNLNRLRKVK